MKLKTHSSCEIEDFVETRILQAVCDTPIARVTGCVLIKDIGRRLLLELQCSLYQGQQGDALVSLCAETIKPVFEGDKIWQQVCGRKCIRLVYQVYPVSRITGEERTKFGGRWRGGRGFENEGGGGGGRGVEVNLCAETINP